MKKTDLWWLLAWPVYQLVGTARHELSHAVVAVWHGARITQIEVLPSFQPEGFRWGYVRRSTDGSCPLIGSWVMAISSSIRAGASRFAHENP